MTKLPRAVPSAPVPYLLVLIRAHGGKNERARHEKGLCITTFLGMCRVYRRIKTLGAALVRSMVRRSYNRLLTEWLSELRREERKKKGKEEFLTCRWSKAIAVNNGELFVIIQEQISL